MVEAAARVLLAPLLVRQAQRVRTRLPDLPEPDGERMGVEGSGGSTLRLLVVGDSSAAGVGAPHQRDALVQPLALALAAQLAVTVRWQLVARSGLTSQQLLDQVRMAAPSHADVAVAICGVNDITHQVPLALALRQRAHLADWLQAHCDVRHVVFPGLPEMEVFPALPHPLAWYAGRLARRNNRAQARWARTRENVSHASMARVARADLFSADGFHPAPALYARVAARLAQHIAAQLAADLADATDRSRQGRTP